jgi:hypothetical protein
MGVATGYLGAAPSIVWASGWFFAAAFPILIPVAIWIYTLVFAFSALWFAHFSLAALQVLRREREPVEVLPPARGGPRDVELIEDARLIPQAPADASGAPPNPPWTRA